MLKLPSTSLFINWRRMLNTICSMSQIHVGSFLWLDATLGKRTQIIALDRFVLVKSMFLRVTSVTTLNLNVLRLCYDRWDNSLRFFFNFSLCFVIKIYFLTFCVHRCGFDQTFFSQWWFSQVTVHVRIIVSSI